MNHRHALAAAAVSAALTSLTAARAARAQQPAPSISATRRDLIEQAQHASQSGDHTSALDLAEHAARISMTPSLRYFIAQEQAALGRLAEAYGNADTCMRETQGATAVRNSAAISATCSALVDQLRGRVGRVVVRAPSPAPAGMHVTVAGVALPDALWGVPYIVTPGRVHIEVTAENTEPFATDADVTANAVVDVPVALRPRAPVVAPESHHAPPPPEMVTVTRINPVPLVPAVVGVLGLVAGGVLYGLAANVSGQCPNAMCATDAQASDGNALATGSYVAFAAGGVLLAAGVAWFAVGGRHTERVPRASASVVPLPGGAGLGISGSF